jgi:enoyl-CoA hydratase/carnithine racemase
MPKMACFQPEEIMKFKTIILEKSEGIARIILNRPDVMNAMTHEMMNELRVAQNDVADDETIRVVVVTGNGRAFCSGADFTLISHLLKLSPKGVFEELRFIQDTATGFETMEKAVIAAINGYALGGGLDLALACDFRIASKGAKMGEQYVKAGLIPDVGGTQRLPRLVGLAKAKEMIFLGDMIDAEEAERIGLVNRVVPREALEQEVNALALKMASAPTIAIGLAKRSIHEGLCRDIRSGLELEALNQSLCMQTSDAKEGIMAILEKRMPRFSGK